MTGWWLRIVGAPLHAATSPGPVADVIVVLGAPLRPDGSLSEVVAERVNAGVELWRCGAAPVLCMTGGRGPSQRHAGTEARAMAVAAVAAGVPSDAVVVEDRSRNTWENARFVAALPQAKHWRSVWVVTQPFHLRRALMQFRRAGFQAYGHFIDESIEFTRPSRGARWIAREYGALLRDWIRR